MEKPNTLYKSTIVIWTEYDPKEAGRSLAELAAEAIDGDAYCDSHTVDRIDNAQLFPETEFFGDGEGE